LAAFEELPRVPAPFRFNESVWGGHDVWSSVDDVRVGRALEEMFGVVPPILAGERTPSAMLIHLQSHWMARRDVFLTNDGGILKRATQLEKLGIKVMRPEDFSQGAAIGPALLRILAAWMGRLTNVAAMDASSELRHAAAPNRQNRPVLGDGVRRLVEGPSFRALTTQPRCGFGCSFLGALGDPSRLAWAFMIRCAKREADLRRGYFLGVRLDPVLRLFSMNGAPMRGHL